MKTLFFVFLFLAVCAAQAEVIELRQETQVKTPADFNFSDSPAGVMIVLPVNTEVEQDDLNQIVRDLSFGKPAGKETFGLRLKEAYNRGRQLWAEGDNILFLSGKYWHLAYGFPEESRKHYNNDAWGLGFGRRVYDENQNETMFWAMVSEDSHRAPLPMVGASWLARWKIMGDVYVGAGYSIAVIAHKTMTNYIPVPVAAPIVSVGGERNSVYVTFINNILYAFAGFQF